MCPAAGGCHGDAHLKIENSFEAMHLIFATYVLIFNINQMYCPAADLCIFLHFINWHTPWLDLFCLYLYIVYLDSLLGFVIFKKLLLEIHEMSWLTETTPDTLQAHDI